MEFSPVKSASSKQVTAHIIEQIRKEDPSFWPYGVSVGHHDGGLFLVREASTREPVGFTGWQRRNDGLKKVAYYSIGILPQHRSKGYAKQAVSMLRDNLAGEVDEIRAFIMPHNEASLGLARTLNIPIELDAPGNKSAHVKAANPLIKALTGQAAKTVLGTGIGGGIGTAMYGKPEQWADNPLAAITGIGTNALLGGHIARLPTRTASGFNRMLAALGVGMGANTVPHLNKALDFNNSMVGQLQDATSDMRSDFDAIRHNETLLRLNSFVQKHPQGVALGTLGVFGAIPLVMAMNNYTEGSRTRAIKNLSEDLNRLQSQDVEPAEDSVKEASWGALAAKLPAIFGTGAGLGGAHVVNNYMYPPGYSDNSILGEIANYAAGAFGGGSFGSSLRNGIKPSLRSQLQSRALVAAPAGAVLGNFATKTRDMMGDLGEAYMEELPAMARSFENLTSPLSGFASLKKYYEDNKSWLMPAAVASHVIPLGVWAHSAYQKDKGIQDMTDHFIDNQNRYLDAHTPRTPQGVRDEPYEEPVEEELEKAAAPLWPRALGAIGNTALWDQYIYGDRDILKAKDWDAGRGLGALLAALSGGSAGSSFYKAKGLTGDAAAKANAWGAAKLMAMPAERFLMTGAAANEAQRSLATGQLGALGKPDPTASTSMGDLVKDNPLATALLTLAGVGGIGYLGHRAVKALEKPQEIKIDQAPAPGHLKITLPTKDPNDNETQVVLPLDAATTVNLSKSLQHTIGRDARRRLRGEATERIRRRPVEDDYDLVDFGKAASITVIGELLANMPA